jgi:Fe-S cluster assembly ATP-binding protein
MARHSRLTVFDEPEAGIDLWSFQNLIRIFESMRSNIQDSAMIIISHQERILKIADEIAVLAEGRLERCGPRDEMLPALIGTESAQDACSRLK